MFIDFTSFTSAIQKVGEANILATYRQISDVLDTTIFLATDLTSCSKMISLWCFCFYYIIFHKK